MYDIVSELNASKTQVFECKQDCGCYSHFCEYCSCICYICLSSKTPHTTSKSEFTMIHQLKLTSAYVTILISIVKFMMH